MPTFEELCRVISARQPVLRADRMIHLGDFLVEVLHDRLRPEDGTVAPACGRNLVTASAAGSKRLVGMRLPGNACPVSGSRMVVARFRGFAGLAASSIAEKSPARLSGCRHKRALRSLQVANRGALIAEEEEVRSLPLYTPGI